jgi:hypothetical protein
MRIDRLRTNRRIDWIRIAFICSNNQGITPAGISEELEKMCNLSKTNREISAIIKAYSNRGFRFEQLKNSKERIYYFEGEILEIHPRTIQRWRIKLNP